MINCEIELRQFLNKEIFPTDFNEIYIGMTSFIVNAPKEIRGANFFFTRMIDTQVLFTDKVSYFYCLIPYFIFVGNIAGINSNNFPNSKVNPIGGKFLTTQMALKDPNVSSFITKRLLEIENTNISDAQNKIIEDMILSNIKKYSNSQSFIAHFLDNTSL
ncbi:hypothetical protein [Emticicia agri]|uniref:Uncharacterized protein n=1 Tax=Emticicia agri TaxID=2492393 RepID=A0A4Q5M226_9BACT|nr:hypothetical protein [Emticicia agri]RYU96334.1 hypothetical protein EWM59_07425 [Emticicia agri]